MDMTAHPLLALAADEPPPFPPSFPQLHRLDRSVMCPICKEPFQGPVSIACGHSFCSSCIRSSLDAMSKKKCPSCDTFVSEGSIRRNRALEEITDAWDEARPLLVTLSQPQAGPSRRRPPIEASSKISSANSLNVKRAREETSSRSPSPSKMRKLEGDEGELPEAILDEEEDDEVVELSEHDEGQCPICSATMSIAAIPLHIERGCPPVKKSRNQGAGNQKSDWKKVFAGAGAGKEKNVELKRIIKPNYNIATPADLRAILNEYELPTAGDKAILQSRVQQWLILFNSNLDTSHPSSLSSLRAKLIEAEASRKRDKEKGKDEAVNQLGTKEGFAKYIKDKKGDFDRLRNEIIERDKRRAEEEKGLDADTAIEVD